MITCSVIRCRKPGTAFAVGSGNGPTDYREAYVCAEHQDMIDAGAPWDMQDRFVLMGQDLPPVLATWSARPSVGSEGITLTLEATGQIKPFEVFLMPSDAKSLSEFLSKANDDVTE
ncbi:MULTISPECIES: hypothetical protein [unclassified Pseudarthrobacter]|uniref:hypothetical protein n=1 Tax=unclassified Pseudarthrobacter TaxID=2647000 RepID=UPI0036359750